MFPFNPDLARLFFGFRSDDEVRRAEHDRRVAGARQGHELGGGKQRRAGDHGGLR